MLLLANGIPTPSEALIDTLWDDPRERPSSRTTLYTYISHVRRVLDDGSVRLLSEAGGYRLEVDPERVDAHRFTRLDREASVAAQAGEHQRAVMLFQQALALWKGPPLENVTSAWATRASVQLGETRLKAHLGYADSRAHLGQDAELITDLTALVNEFPLHEAIIERLMLALARAGRQSDALAQYRALRARLSEELGIEPGNEVQKAHERILRGEVRSVSARSPQLSNSRAGRPEKALDSSASPVALFAQQLRTLRHHAGSPTFRTLASWTGLSSTTLSKALSGERLPTSAVTLALVRVLGGNEAEWRQRWAQVAADTQPKVEPVWPHSPEEVSRPASWPQPGSPATPAEFVQQMRRLKAWVGNPSLRQLGQRGGVPASTLSDVLRRDQLPRRTVLQAFLVACGVPAEWQSEWEAAWLALAARK